MNKEYLDRLKTFTEMQEKQMRREIKLKQFDENIKTFVSGLTAIYKKQFIDNVATIFRK